KNFGLYRERVGALSVLAVNSQTRDTIASQVSMAARTLYSMPPDHGAAVVARILDDEALTQRWHDERNAMRDRLSSMRTLLCDALKNAAPDHSFDHLVQSKGMFCYLGIDKTRVAALKKDFGIYMADSSRINVAGITQGNVDYLANAIASVL
ncbi:MAG: aminotransferase class I/II-fold pyridoxal phosphate-dependent enzyme, partial [Pseudomonadota bacterium]